jgi:pSer/pThr/pTyr-binding forkhead associated (FHA) protein
MQHRLFHPLTDIQTRPHTRTKVTVTDLNSKKGTLVDGEQIQGGERVLNGDEHIIQLGRYGHPLRSVFSTPTLRVKPLLMRPLFTE